MSFPCGSCVGFPNHLYNYISSFESTDKIEEDIRIQYIYPLQSPHLENSGLTIDNVNSGGPEDIGNIPVSLQRVTNQYCSPTLVTIEQLTK